MRGMKSLSRLLMCVVLAAGAVMLGNACHHLDGTAPKKITNAKLVTVQSTLASPEITAGTYVMHSAPATPETRRYVANALYCFGLTETADPNTATYIVDSSYTCEQITTRGRMAVTFTFAIRKNDAAKTLLWRADGVCAFHPKYDAYGFAPSVIACTLFSFNQPVVGMVNFNNVKSFYERIIAQ